MFIQRPPRAIVTRSKSSHAKNKSSRNIKVSNTFKKDVRLCETENAWRPNRGATPAGAPVGPEDDRKTQDLYKRVRGVLNKLTPQKFETLLSQIKELPIDTPERLQGVIDLVFEKAVDEPNFSVAYALMCREVALMQVPVAPNSTEYVNFRKLLVTRCQHEFEKSPTTEEAERQLRLKDIDECADADEKTRLLMQFEEDEQKVRRKGVGNIRFIGMLCSYYLILLRAFINYVWLNFGYFGLPLSSVPM